MKDILTEELAEISAEIHEAAVRVGCTHVSVTGEIWPGGQVSGPPEQAARFVEFSWLRAAAINGRAIFEEPDPQRYHDLLVAYGLEDPSSFVPPSRTPEPDEAPAAVSPELPTKGELIAQVLPGTRRELERRARAAGMSVGEFLDLVFTPGDRGAQ